MVDFVTFEIAKKLKEKGFECVHPFAMYNEKGVFHDLCTSAEYITSESGFKYRCYYDNDDSDERDCVAPTIAQVMDWLRDEKSLYITVEPFPSMATKDKVAWSWSFSWNSDGVYMDYTFPEDGSYRTYEEASLAGIAYVLNNLI